MSNKPRSRPVARDLEFPALPTPISASFQERVRQRTESAIDHSLDAEPNVDIASVASTAGGRPSSSSSKMARHQRRNSGDLIGAYHDDDSSDTFSLSSSSSIAHNLRSKAQTPFIRHAPLDMMSSDNDDDGDVDGQSTISSVEYGRGAAATRALHPLRERHENKADTTYNSHSLFVGGSPLSSAGHHASAVTLGLGVFDRKTQGGNVQQEEDDGGEYDPDRSLGRLVRQLKMNGANWEKLGESQASKRPPFAKVHKKHVAVNQESRAPASRQPSIRGAFLPVPQQQQQHRPPRSSPLRSEAVFSSFSADNGKENHNAGGHEDDDKSEAASNFTDFVNKMRADLGIEGDSRRRTQIKQPRGSLDRDGGASVTTSTPAPLGRSKKGSKEPLDLLGDDEETPKPVKQARQREHVQQGRQDGTARPMAAGRSASDGEVRERQTQREQSRRARVVSDPASRGHDNGLQRPILPDMTALSALLNTPAKGAKVADVDRNAGGDDLGSRIPDAVQQMYSRMQALEQETTKSRQRMRELEAELKRAKAESDRAQRDEPSERGHQGDEWEARALKLQEQKKDLEMLVAMLKQNIKTVQKDWEVEMAEVASLRRQLQKQVIEAEGKQSQSSSRLQSLYDEAIERIERLEQEVKLLKGTVIEALEVRRATRSEDASAKQPTRYDVGVQTVAQRGDAPSEALINDRAPAAESKAQHSADNKDGKRRAVSVAASEAESPFPSIRGEDLERDFFSPAPKLSARSRQAQTARRAESVKDKSVQERAKEVEDALSTVGERLPPQTLVISVLREIEDDYRHYLKIYAELAEQYKRMSPTHTKRHILAEHLKEVIDTMEEKANQVARLTEAIELKDKAYKAPILKAARPSKQRLTVPETVRAVRKDLGHGVITTPSRSHRRSA